MNLIVDIGNSSVKAALFKGSKMVARERLAEPFAESVARFTRGVSVSSCAYSAVGEVVSELQAELLRLAPKVLQVKGTTPTPLTCDYLTPETLGPDRLAACVGAFHLAPGKDLLVVDAGTCITYDYVSAEAHYLGGNISPGLGIRLRAMQSQTAALPLASAEGFLPEVGIDTQTALRAGAIRGMDFEIAGYIHDFVRHHPRGEVFLTGGNAHRFVQGFKITREPALVEIGLNRILLQL